MILLRTLGTVRVDSAAGVALSIAGQQPKRLALLVYLAIARPTGWHRRDALVALFWPELDQSRARAALRQALHGIRQSLGAGAIVSSGTESIGLDHRALCCDLWDLENAAVASDHARVLTLSGGELAHGLFVADAPGFEQWLDAERRRVHAIVVASAWMQATSARDAGRSAEVIQLVTLAVSRSEFDESAVRRAMHLLDDVGERATAIAIYERFAAELARELGAEPSMTTRATVARLREAQPRVPFAATASVASPAAAVTVAETVSAAPWRPRSLRTWRRVAAATLSIIALATAARLAPSASMTLDPRRLRVEAFSNESALPALDTLARIATLDAREALVPIDGVEVTSSRGAGDPAWRDTSRRLPDDRAGTLIRGIVRVVGDSVDMRAEVVDQATQVIRRTVISRSHRAALGGNASALRAGFNDRLRAAVATSLYPGWGNALSQPPSYAGYRLFLDGMQSIKRERHDAALASFRRAFEEDSAFTAAGLLAGTELYQLRRFAAAESIVVAIDRRRALLPPVDAHLLEWLTRSLRGDRIGARTAMAAITTIAPTAELAWLQLAIDNVETARPREALAALDHISRETDFGEGWPSFWATRIEALHIMGDHARELAVVREGRRRHPDVTVLANYELRALAALGRTREIDGAARRLASGAGFDVPLALRQTALELAAHGDAASASALLREVRAWYVARPDSERTSLRWRAGYARTLYLADDRRGARAMYDSLLRAYPKCLDCVGALGVLAARDGDRATARSSAERLVVAELPFHFGRNTLWRSRIAAALGDRSEAASLLSAAFAAGAEFDVMTHTDMDLSRLKPDSLYRLFARPGE